MRPYILGSFATTAALVQLCGAQSTASCNAPSPSGSIKPSVASGYRLQVVATGLSRPRGLHFDGQGRLLVVQQGSGVVSAHVLNDTNGCVTVSQSKNLTDPTLALNHGIEMSSDGQTLYASSSDEAFQWAYNVADMSVSNRTTLVTGMSGSDHSTRTLLLSRRAAGYLIISRGSTSNIDIKTADLASGLSQVRAFSLSNTTSQGYDYSTDGLRLGWGLRNEVGLAEHPSTGGIWGVENSADQISRMGVDVHENNPAEELNYFGPLDGAAGPTQGRNFGYPWCFTAWNPAALPNNNNLTVGRQFAVDATSASDNRNQTDQYCAAQVGPRLSFQAHMAPLDIKFNNSGQQAWITFHGSWNRDAPVGYKLSVVSFGDDGQPVEPANSSTAAVDIVSNADNSKCPSNCFRPAAMAIDRHGRIFMSSDASGEIYMVTKDAAASGTAGNSTGSGNTNSASHSGLTWYVVLSSLLPALLAMLSL